MMWALVQLMFQLCLLRKAPQDIPYSQAVLSVLVLIYAIVAYLVLLPQDDFLKTILEVWAEVFLTSAFVWGLLAISHKSARFIQVLCAFLGTDALISLFSVPVLVSMNSGQLEAGSVSLLLVLMLWHWIVCGHIIRHALEQPFAFGLSVAFLYNISFYQLMALLFPMAAV